MAETLFGSKSNPISKPALRTHSIQTRKNLSLAHRQTAAEIIRQKVLFHPNTRQARTIAIYISTAWEVDTHQLIRSLLQQKKALYAPTITQNTITLRKLESLDTCVPGPKNILEPPASAITINSAGIDLFIIPGLAFDAKGHRLGYGKGYYDQLLKNTPGFKLGISFTDQLRYSLPKDPWDVKMHQVITDQITLKGDTL